MTVSQIKTILEEIGNYSLDMIISLEEVFSIVLDSNESIFIDPSRKFKFNSNYNLLEIYNTDDSLNSIVDGNKIISIMMKGA